MRVIAGSARGTKLAAPEGDRSRPVLDRVKESWFASIISIRGGRLEGARVLDLYCGVGSLGIEALSRGAGECVFVERNAECVRLLADHLARTRLADRATVKRCVAELAVWDLVRAHREFDLIFVDPPFVDTAREDYLASDPAFARLGEIASEGALVMLRRESETKPRRRRAPKSAEGPADSPPSPAGLRFLKSRQWGRNEVLFYERPGKSPGPKFERPAADIAGG